MLTLEFLNLQNWLFLLFVMLFPCKDITFYSKPGIAVSTIYSQKLDNTLGIYDPETLFVECI